VMSLRAGDRFARILVPASALAANDTLTAMFPDASDFSPSLTAFQQDAGLYVDVSLGAHAGDFLSGKRALIELEYPDADGDDLLDATELRAPLLRLCYLPTPTSSFSSIAASSVSRSRHCVVGETRHFSVFGVIEEQSAASLNLMTDILPPGTVGAAYTAALEANGGTPPYTWALVSGTLPPGLGIVGNSLEGTPTTPGEFAFTLQVSDSQSMPSMASCVYIMSVFAADQPTVTVARSAGQPGLANGLPIHWDITFSASVTGFETSDIVLTGTAATDATYAVSGSGTNYTLAITSLPYDGTLRPTAPAGAATTGTALSRASTEEEEVWMDRKPPLAAIACAHGDAGSSSPIVLTDLPILFTLTFDENVTGLDAGDIAFAETIPGLAFEVQGSGKSYALLITVADAGTTFTPTLAADAVQDASGNGNAETAYSGRTVEYAPDTRATVTLNQRDVQPDPTGAFPIYLDIVFSDAVTGFDANDLTYIGTAPSPQYAVTGNGTDYTLRVTGTGGDGRVAFIIPEDKVTEGNRASSSMDNVVYVDTTPPGIALGAPSSLRTHYGPVSIPVTYTGASAVTLNAGHVTVSGSPTAHVAQVLVTGTTLHKRIVTLSGISGYGTLSVSVAAGTATDAVGNTAPGAGPSASTLVGAPTADFTATPTSGSTPLLVQFTDTSDPGALPIDEWHWDFGDGWTSDEQNPEHLYETPGGYTVSLTVTSDVASDTCTRWGYITVDAQMPAADWPGLVLAAALLTLCAVLLIGRKEAASGKHVASDRENLG